MNFKHIQMHQKAFLDKAKARKKPEVFDLQGIKVTVNLNVFPPATDTKLLVENIHVNKGDKILDLTTGSGIVAIAAGLQGATGLAIDINPDAVNNANENFKKLDIQMNAIESDLFNNCPDEQFDQIFVNGPYVEGDITHPLDYSCYGARKFVENVFLKINKYFKNDGKLLIVMSSWSDLDHFYKIAQINELKISLIATKVSNDGQRTYNLYEIKLSSVS